MTWAETYNFYFDTIISTHLATLPSGHHLGPMIAGKIYDDPSTPRLDPRDDPDGEPPSLNKRSIDFTEASSPLAGNPSEQPNSPDDERVALLISLGTPDDAPAASSYDPFATQTEAYNGEEKKTTTDADEIAGPAGMLSPQSVTSEKSHTSPALRGAQEILKKNRRKRLEMYVVLI